MNLTQLIAASDDPFDFSQGVQGTLVSARELERAANPCAIMPHEFVTLGGGASLALLDLVFDADCTIPMVPKELAGSLGVFVVLTGRMVCRSKFPDEADALTLNPGDCMINRIAGQPGMMTYEGGSHLRALGLTFWPEDVERLLTNDWGELSEAVETLLGYRGPSRVVDGGDELRAVARMAFATPLAGTLREEFIRSLAPAILAIVSRNLAEAASQSRVPAEVGLIELACAARDSLVRNLDDPRPFADIAAEFGVSPRALGDAIRAVFGAGPAEVVREGRLLRAREQLRQPGADIDRVAREAGYRHRNNFSIAFRKRFNLPPRTFQRQETSA